MEDHESQEKDIVVIARPLEEEWEEAEKKHGINHRGEAFLKEAMIRAEQLAGKTSEEIKSYEKEGKDFLKKREEQGLEVHQVASRVGITSLDLWFFEGGMPPLNRPREEVVEDLNQILSVH